MALDRCLAPLLAEGKIDQDLHDEALGLFEDLQRDYRRQFGDQTAAAMATAQTLKQLERNASRKRFLAGLAIATRQRMEMEMGGFGGGNGGGPIDPAAGPAFLSGDGRASYSNVELRMRAVRGRAHAMIDEILARHSTNAIGQLRDQAGLMDLVREAFGEDSGNPHARELVDGWNRAAEMLRQRRNAAGGDTGKLDNWGLPQYHEPRLVRKAGFEEWRDFTLPKLDRAKIIDERTGLPISDGALELALRDTWEKVRSDGWSARDVGSMGGKSLANQRGESRFLVFKSADDWMAYSERFGAGNPFDAMMGHIDGMSRDIALMEILGPNPDATVKWLKDTISKSAELDVTPDSKATDQAFAAGRKIDRLYSEVTGDLGRPEGRKLALAFSALRSWQVATKLGGALLSAVSDLGFGFATRKFNGLPAAGMLKDYVKLFRPGALEDQKLAVRRGLIAEEWSNRVASQHRYMGEELTGEVSKRLAESVLRLSGLSRFTQAGRWAYGMEVLATLTEARGKTLGELDPALQAMMARHGLGKAEWDAIRSAPTVEDRGVDWIDPPSLPDRELGDRLLEMIARETDRAVPMPGLNTRSIVNSVAPAGTLHGEIIKSAFLFKGFGISVLIDQAHRIVHEAAGNRLRYATGLAIATTIGGAASLWLKDIAAGRDPREARDIPFVDDKTGDFEFNPGFWGQAMIQGGGFGIFGDFLKSSTNRAGGGITDTLAGPLWSDAQQVLDVASSKNKGRALLKAAREQIPGGTLWYARLAFDRQITDQLQEAIDPNYRQSWREMERWADEQGTQFYWEPGDTMPERAPDLSNAIGENR